ncbi:hypothetical protein ACMFMF_009833 [Clarireedia jacksonii]
MANSSDMDKKAHDNEVELVENVSTINSALPNKAANATPAYIASLTQEGREAAENALRRKIDIRLMPMIVLIYIMNYLDRNNIAAARLAGLEDDLNLQGNQFQPGCLYYLSAWYTRKELVKRTALLYSGALLSGAFSGLIAAGITNGLNGAKGLAAWRWLFLVGGAITVFIAIFAFFILPDLPRTTTWLSNDEKELAAWRLEEDIGQDDWVDSKRQTFLHGAKLAVKFVEGLGKNNITTLLLTTPPYLIAFIAILCNAWHADKTGERYLHVAIPPVIAFISFVIAASTIGFAPRYLAMCLMVGANYCGYVVALGWISNVLPRPPSKRAAALAGINALSNPATDPVMLIVPLVKAMCVNLAMSVLSIIFATILRFHLVSLNKRLDRGEVVEGVNSSARGDFEEGEGEAIAVERGFRFLY